MNEKSSKIFDEINKEKLDSHLEGILPINSAILNKGSNIVKQYLGYCSIENDIEFVKLSVEKLIKIRINDYDIIRDELNYTDTNFILKRSLYISSIISYSRCFNSTKGRIAINIDFIKKGFSKDSSEILSLIAFHNRLLELRNKFVAHADDYHLEQIIGFIQFDFVGNILESKMNYAFAGIYSFNEEELDTFLILADLLLENLHKKKQNISVKIAEEITNEGLIKMALQVMTK